MCITAYGYIISDVMNFAIRGVYKNWKTLITFELYILLILPVPIPEKINLNIYFHNFYFQNAQSLILNTDLDRISKFSVTKGVLELNTLMFQISALLFCLYLVLNYLFLANKVQNLMKCLDVKINFELDFLVIRERSWVK